MKLNLKKPLVVFDLEATGLDLVHDRVIQLSYIKVLPNGSEERADYVINPCCPIPAFITQLTGIDDAAIADKPTFKQLAHTLADKFKGCDFAGFNINHFDIPLLAEEFLRAGIDFDFSHCRFIDAMAIFHKFERRNLASAYKLYVGRRMDEDFKAHRADQDTEATYRVLQAQLDYYSEDHQRALGEDPEGRVLVNDMDSLAEFSRTNNVDLAGRIVWDEAKDDNGNAIIGDDGKPVLTEYFNFGKYKGKTVVDALNQDQGYFSWIMNGDFTYNTKQVLTRIRLRELAKSKNS